MRDNFASYDQQRITHLDEPYDYGSVMHYERSAFSYDNTRTTITIEPKQSGVQIGQRVGMDDADVRKLNKHYGCGAPVTNPGPGKTTKTPPKTTTTTEAPDEYPDEYP